MSVADTTGTRTRSTADPRTACCDLRAERAQLARWRRLVRARLDLAVAAYAPPEALGTRTWDLVPAAHVHLPPTSVLAGAVAVPPPADGVALLEQLRTLDRILAAYGDGLDAVLKTSTDAAVAQVVPGRRRDLPGLTERADGR